MSEAIAIPQSLRDLQKQLVPEADFAEIAGSGASFLPRLQLFTANSEEVKQMKIPMATYGIVTRKADPIIQLGATVQVMPLAYRPKAMDVRVNPVVSYHKPDSSEFRAIKDEADRDSNSGKMYGPEFLMWVKDHGFAVMMFGSKTARNVAPSVRALVCKYALLSAKYISTPKTDKKQAYSWHGPEICVSSQAFQLWEDGTLEAIVTTFLNPKDSVVAEEAPEGTGAAPDER